MSTSTTHSIGRRLSAWGVHVFTASGTVLGMLSLLAVIDGNPTVCLLWLGLALIVDGIDGTLARRAAVTEVLPDFDGSALDLVVDYLTYVLVPAIFLYRFGLLPDGFGTILTTFILLTSLYCFCNVHMKSGDNYFVGFPAIWNVVALYLWVLDWHPAVNAAVVLVIGALTFTTIKFLHPFRVRKFMPINIAVTAVWMASSLALLLAHPARPMAALVPWFAASAYYVGICLWRTVRGPR
ncbi:MAG TPA: phosphatidylcholine/phosphatidylserine synthase [Arenibaculum sp.]|nr:phosphatidylcholine/phosphatidylserine synthase [Arenibaculum sp.]